MLHTVIGRVSYGARRIGRLSTTQVEVRLNQKANAGSRGRFERFV